MKLISVVIPYYRKRNYFQKTLNSVLRQTYKNIEIIIVYDDPLSDDLKYIMKIIKKDHRILLIKNHQNLGAGKSRNLGIKYARGFYIAFIDADDLWSKNKLKNQINFMEKNHLQFSFTSYKIINEKGLVIKIKKAPKLISYSQLLNNCNIGLSTVILEKKLISKNCSFPELKTKEDYVLWLKLAKKIKYLCGFNEFLTKWRKLENSLSSNFFQKIVDGFRVYYKYLNFNFAKSLFYLILLSLNYIKKNI